MDNFDVIIVGAGPAGSIASLYLSRAGYKVLLLDKAHFPRKKVCGDACSAKGLEIINELGFLDEILKLPHVKVNHLLMSAPNSSSVIVDYQPREFIGCSGFVVERVHNDNAIFSVAKKESTTIEGFSVDKLIFEGNKVIGVEGTTENGERKKFHAKVVVGADGANSVVARAVGSENVDNNHRCGAVRGYYSGVTGLTDTIELYFIDGIIPGYFWIFPMANGIANVGLGLVSSKISKKKISLMKMMDIAINSPQIKERFKNAKLLGKIDGWIIPFGSKRVKNHGNGWVLVGDAASLADPLSGEGFGNAALSGKFAAQVIIKALKNNDFSESAFAEYEKLVSDAMDKEFHSAYLLQRVSNYGFLINMFIDKAAKKPEFKALLEEMMENNDARYVAHSPLFYLKLLLT